MVVPKLVVSLVLALLFLAVNRRDPALTRNSVPAVQRDHAGATQANIVLKTEAGILDLTITGASAQLVYQFIALGKSGRTKRMSLGQETTRRVDNVAATEGVVAVHDQLFSLTPGDQPQRFVSNDLVRCETIVQFDHGDIGRPDARSGIDRIGGGLCHPPADGFRHIASKTVRGIGRHRLGKDHDRSSEAFASRERLGHHEGSRSAAGRRTALQPRDRIIEHGARQHLLHGELVAEYGLRVLRGYGLDQHITDSYRFLCERYRPGDRIAIFGFSRGAYTARALAGLIHLIGILRPEQANLAAFALKAYKQSSDADDLSIGWSFARALGTRRATVQLLGLWDTVGSMIAPLKDRVGFGLTTLPYTNRNPSVAAVRHAPRLSIRASALERRRANHLCARLARNGAGVDGARGRAERGGRPATHRCERGDHIQSSATRGFSRRRPGRGFREPLCERGHQRGVAVRRRRG